MSDPSRYSFLLICRSYPPVLGGSEIEAQRVCAALTRRGHTVTVLCAGGAPMPDRSRWIDPEGVPVRLFGARWPERVRDYAYAFGVVWTLVRERRHYQFVYFLMQGVHLAAGLPIARALNKPVLMKISGSNLITVMRQSRMGRLELRMLRKWAARVMILNDGMAEEAAAARIPKPLLLWMPNPVDTEAFAPCDTASRKDLRLKLGVPLDCPMILFVGRLAPEKELESLLEGFSIVVKRFPDALLTLAGAGPERGSIERRSRELSIDGAVRFPGRQTTPQVVEWLQASDAFALVSSLEGFPVSLVEAMSAGLPSVVSDIPANLQLIDQGVHGLHAKLRDPASIADAISALLADRKLREDLGANARRRVISQYSSAKITDRYEALFSEVTGGAKTLD